MTLCIAFKYRHADGIPRAIAYSDSLITVLGSNASQTAIGTFLPSNAEVKHQTPKGIKIQIVTALTKEGEVDRDFVFSIAGAVPLGLQSLIHLDSVFKTFCDNYSFEEYITKIKETLFEFWQDAYDKDIDYLLAATSDDRETKIFHIQGTGSDSNLYFEEVQPENGITLAVIGDCAGAARSQIMTEVNALMCGEIELYSALDVACIRMLRRAIEDDTNRFVGGNIQACWLIQYKANYIALDNGRNLIYRGIEYSREWNDYPRNLNTEVDRAGFLTTKIDQDIYDPQMPIEQVVANFNSSPL